MRGGFDRIADASRSLRRGTPLSQDARGLATQICRAVRAPPGEEPMWHRGRFGDGGSESCRLSAAEWTCVALTLVEKVTSRLMCRGVPAESRRCLTDVSAALFQELDLMPTLVDHFQSEDRFISHLAAKCVAVHIVYQLQTSGTVSQTWQQKCVQVFKNCCPCNGLDSCMWSLTQVVKKTLKATCEGKPEILEKLLADFYPCLSSLCSKLLPVEGGHCWESAVCFITPGHRGATLSTFLDLLEVLTATRLLCGTTVCLQSQRLAYIHTPALLRIVHSDCDYFVKKRVLLLLKRTLLQKAGEDMALGEVSAAAPKDENFATDMTTLAESVLQAVHAGWLQYVPVENAASFFGHASQVCVDGGQKSDYGMLRAVSLVVLKSLEFKIQCAGETAGVDGAVKVHRHLQALLQFLSQRGVPLKESSHPCTWHFLVFGEQDDDMLEAAKALFSLFLHHRSSELCAAASEAACASGFNPHCHFLLLLQSISFDHSILLDFLISTETCFLEYIVRYLKHLRADREGFLLALVKELRDWSVTLKLKRHTLSQIVVVHLSSQDLVQSSLGVQPMACIPSVGEARLNIGLCLVDYESSEESDTDDMEVSKYSLDTKKGKMRPQPTVSNESRLRDLDAIPGTSGLPDSQAQTQIECKPRASTPGAQTESRPRFERTTRRLSSTSSLQMTQTGQTPSAQTELSKRTVVCLSQLREVVARLRMKNIFPYNPTCLLKLLDQFENVSCS
ncbi:protein Lines homolog 1 [Lampris incognitus]|uniref:protein Lines homolog 1 n=1 Tax=Lampris incognitus TaxID=2546036 RepID=UPI0024B61F7B|nr:protein Lines homolog 1 [Lampris incognitus]